MKYLKGVIIIYFITKIQLCFSSWDGWLEVACLCTSFVPWFGVHSCELVNLIVVVDEDKYVCPSSPISTPIPVGLPLVWSWVLEAFGGLPHLFFWVVSFEGCSCDCMLSPALFCTGLPLFLVALALMKMLSQSTNEKISPAATWESYML